jgi:hypothetical protein
MPNVTVSQPGVISVRVGTGQQPTVDTLTYGTRTLKSASDLELAGASNNSVISYNSNTQSFFVVPAGNLPLNLDAGSF